MAARACQFSRAYVIALHELLRIILSPQQTSSHTDHPDLNASYTISLYFVDL